MKVRALERRINQYYGSIHKHTHTDKRNLACGVRNNRDDSAELCGALHTSDKLISLIKCIHTI